jgi:two-component system, NtrC family, response regulator PilR
MDRLASVLPVASTLPAVPGLLYAPGSPLEACLRLAKAAAHRDCPVFLRGESGSGKEAMARFLHAHGPRGSSPLVAVNCAALPPGLIESELFGHRKGAFTGAWADSPGRFRQAEGGSLFLDEIGDMPLEVQTRLLRVLQEKCVSPVGDAREHPVDFRLLCATHRDLREEVRAGRFREDLFYRIHVVEIRLPALRDRPMDIPPLLRHFLAGLLPAEAVDRACATFPAALLALPFPGNIRELRNLAERYCVLRDLGGGWADAAAAVMDPAPYSQPAELHSTVAPGSLPDPVSERLPTHRLRNSRLSDGEILGALDACGRHRGRASALLGITRRALQYRLAKMEQGTPTIPR